MRMQLTVNCVVLELMVAFKPSVNSSHFLQHYEMNKNVLTPVSQEILSLGNIVTAIIFPKEIVTAIIFPNSVARIKHACFVSNCDIIENSHMHLMHSEYIRSYREQYHLMDLLMRPGESLQQSR